MPLAIFDLDNTLLDREQPVRQWARQFVARHQLDPSDVDWLIAADGDGFVSRPVFLTSVRERYGLAESLDSLLRSYRTRIVELVELDPTVPVALESLREAGWRIAIATNGTTDQQWAKIRTTGLERYVDAVAVSEEVGADKPDPRMFEVAAQRCGANLADGGWMIGDCATRDIGGGQRVGLRTIWLHRGRAWGDAPPPDAIASHVAEAVTRLLPKAAITPADSKSR